MQESNESGPRNPSWFVSKYDPSMCDKALELFKKGKSVSYVCAELGIVRDTYYAWKKQKPEFGLVAQMGEHLSQKYWEDIGEKGIIGSTEKFAGSSWQFVMKNRFREDYKADNVKPEEGGTAVEMLLKMLVEKESSK